MAANMFGYVGGNPINLIDANGLRVSLMYRPLKNAFIVWDHVAVNVNGTIIGFHPEGVLQESIEDYSIWGAHESVVFDDDCHDKKILDFLLKAYQGNDPRFQASTYSAWSFNCFDFARIAIQEGSRP